MLWSLGKNLFHGGNKRRAIVEHYHTRADYSDAALAEKVQALTVQQVTTSLRMQGVAGDDDTMLTSLETMALAGEIPFSDFIGRVQNLFPRAIESLDVPLRMKISALLLPR